VAKPKTRTAPGQLPLPSPTPTVTVGRRVLHPPATVPWSLITIVLPPYFKRRILNLLLEAHRIGWQVDVRLIQVFM
jgi:hypothetical protein